MSVRAVRDSGLRGFAALSAATLIASTVVVVVAAPAQAAPTPTTRSDSVCVAGNALVNSDFETPFTDTVTGVAGPPTNVDRIYHDASVGGVPAG